MLVFWETTRACGLACRHCRASALPDPLPGQLSTAEGFDLLEQIAGFGRPYPVVVLTGGDCLLRPDLFDLVAYATGLGLPVALSPAVTPVLTRDVVARIRDAGVRAVSVSLDGATPATHDGVRGVPGHLTRTREAISWFVEAGLTVQVNTTVMRGNVTELADVAAFLVDDGVDIWEVFFLVEVGRGGGPGSTVRSILPSENEAVCHFLYDSAQHGFIVRTVEAPFFRPVVRQRAAGGRAPALPLYRQLHDRLEALLGPPRARIRAHTTGTRDGKGIVFVAHDGDVYPAGFLPLTLGSVRRDPLARIYRDAEGFRALREARFEGRCGRCEHADLCGGSRSRAWTATGNLLAEDPACPLPV